MINVYGNMVIFTLVYMALIKSYGMKYEKPIRGRILPTEIE